MIEYNNLINDIITTKISTITSLKLFLFIIFALLISLIIDTEYTPKTTNNPEILFLITINSFLKKLIIDPIITTGCILVGSSPNIMSIINDNSKANIINKNNFNDVIVLILVVIISLIKLLYSIIV